MAQYDINLREYWRILKKRKSIVIITAILLGLFSTIFAVFQAPTPLYTSVCSIKFEKETTLEGLYARTLSWSGGDDIETQISIVTGFSVLEDVAKNMGLIPANAASDDPVTISCAEQLKDKIEVERESYTNILNIKVTDPSPVFAQRMANELAITYKKLHSEQQGKRTVDAIKYIDEQLRNVRQKLRDAEREFNRFSQVNQLISIDLQSENLLLRKKEISDEIRKQNDDKDELEALSERINNFIKTPSFSDANFYSSKANPQYEKSNNTLVELVLKRDTLLENYTSQHPEVIGIGLKIIENARKMALLLKLQINNIEKRNRDLKEELASLDSKTGQLMEKKLEYDRLKREVDSFRDMTALLEQKNQEALIKKAEKPEEVVVVKKALLPAAPINPPKTAATGAMGVVIGVVLGLVFAFIIETFDTSLGAIEDVEETLGAKVLGVIPDTDAKDIIASLKDRYPKELDEHSLRKIISLVSHFAPKTMIAESFRALRTNIQFREDDEKVKTIAITSTSPQEGKTLVSVNLAISLAQAGLKTLLVGSDLRKPMLAKVFGLEGSPGLTDIIMGNYPWADTVKSITDIIMGRMSMDDIMLTPGMDNLNIITSGDIPPNPAELIESERLVSFLKEAEKEYDIIIFDSTPVLSTADAAILGKKMDGVLIVYRVGAVSRGLLKRTSTQLEQVKCNIIGVILNGMKPDISPDFPDYKYYKYFSYYGEEGKKEAHQISKRAFPFFWKRAEDSESAGESLPASSTSKAPENQKTKKSIFLRGFLIICALLFLAGGFLWQEGIFDPVTPINSDDVKPPVIKEKPHPSVKRSPKPSPAKPPPVEDTISEKKEAAVEAAAPLLSEPDAMTSQKTEEPADEEATYQPASFPFSLYFGSFNTKEKAEKAIAQYKRKDLSPFWVQINFKDKGSWYRVYAGYFSEYARAKSFAEGHELTEAAIKKTAYANLVGMYKTPSDLEEITRTIKSLGYSPYVVKDQDGNHVLFVGAFITKAGAEEQNREMLSDGVHSQVVSR